MNKLKTFVEGVPVEGAVWTQLANLSKLNFVERLALMPDCHVGRGSTVGTVIATKNAIIPAAVGVDLGCGMNAVKTSLKAADLPDNLADLRSAIELAVPHGGPGITGSWKENGRYGAPAMVATAWKKFEEEYKQILEFYPQIDGVTVAQLGTLGTGNHFVEICLEKADDSVWIMLHSGSRGLGNRIGSFFIEKAKEEMREWHVNLPDKEMAYLKEGSEYFDHYCNAVEFAQEFAAENRSIMLRRVLAVLSEKVKPFTQQGEAISCHHNYIQKEYHFGDNLWVTRKGAVNAEKDKLGIIPGSMGAKSFIVRGLGNPDSLNSCSHGAGRVMSRTEAKKLITMEDHLKDTSGVECRKDKDVIDESPKAYKNIDDVMNAQKDLVEIVAEIKQVLCVKG